jgi:hypothetical protein
MIKNKYMYLFSEQSNLDKVKSWWSANLNKLRTPFEVIPGCGLLDTSLKPDNTLAELESKIGKTEDNQ